MSKKSPLLDYTVQDYAEWLIDNLSAYYGEDRTAKHFAFSLPDIELTNFPSNIDRLVEIYRKISQKNKPLFRKSIGVALTQAATSDLKLRATNDLISLIGLLNAYDSIEALPTVCRNHSKWGESGIEIIYNSISVLKGLADSPVSYEAIREIASSQNIPNECTFDIYQALVSGSPRRWVNDLINLNTRFESIINNKPTLWANKEHWFDTKMGEIANFFAFKLSLRNISLGLEELDRHNNFLDGNKPAGILLRKMFVSGPFLYETDSSSIPQLALHDNSAKEDWPRNADSLDVYLWSIGAHEKTEPETSITAMFDQCTDEEIKQQVRHLLSVSDYYASDIEAANDEIFQGVNSYAEA